MPQLPVLTYNGGTRVFSWKVTEQYCELVGLCHDKNIDTAEFDRFGSQTRQVERAVELLLLTDIFGDGVVLRHNSEGAPSVDNGAHISISHTRGLVCVAVDMDKPIGIDVEYKSDRVVRVRSKFLDDDESRRIGADDVDMNLAVWTAKEAMYKLLSKPGVSLQDNLHVADVRFGKDRVAEYSGYADHGGEVVKIKLVTHVTDTEVFTYASIDDK